MDKDQFINAAYEIAFGVNVEKRNFSFEQVLEQLRGFSDLALEKKEI